eukprot:scpid87707/ scgid16447/ tRNA wybutosine-synthesizing protein 2 homolog; Alpha-amino-alpha-carboxypropyl transferase TYW2
MAVTGWAIQCERTLTKVLKIALEEKSLYDGTRCIGRADDEEKSSASIPITDGARSVLCKDPIIAAGQSFGAESIVQVCLRPSRASLLVSPSLALCRDVLELARQCAISAEHVAIPQKWQCHADLAVLPPGSFTEECWKAHTQRLWLVVAKALKVNRLVRQGRISDTGERFPQVDLLLGSDPWVHHVDNGVTYSFDVRHCMFSQGNITEKIRMSKLPCHGETVVDLFVGIGYFTLPLLKHAGAECVHACDWNSHAIAALKAGASCNQVQDRLHTYYGDNDKVCPVGIADRVLLGLIPCSGRAWLTACKALKPASGGWLHIHGNVVSSSLLSKLTGHASVASVGSKQENDRIVVASGANGLDCCTENNAAENPSEPPENDLLPCGSPTEPSRVSFSWTKHQQGNSDSASNTPICSSNSSHGAAIAGIASSTSSMPLAASGHCVCRVCPDCKTLHCQMAVHTGLGSGCSLCHGPVSDDAAGQSSSLTACKTWAADVVLQVTGHLEWLHTHCWKVECRHIEHVKSYAPHIDHVVLDLFCAPC